MINNTEKYSSTNSYIHAISSSPAQNSTQSAKAFDSRSCSMDLLDEYLEKEIIIQPFCSNRLQWYTNEEIFKILCESIQLISLASKHPQYKDLKEQRFSSQALQLPQNGSVFVFDRREVKNYKKDAYCWKRRKTGSAKSVREDRMCLKINGIEVIYGCYSHSCLMYTFHRRIYWLLDKPDIVLVHYLQIPNNETGESLISLNYLGSEFQMNKESVAKELKSMLWPHYLRRDFILQNLKLNEIHNYTYDETSSIDLVEVICNRLYSSTNFSKTSFRMVFNNPGVPLATHPNKSSAPIPNLINPLHHEFYKSNHVKLSLDFSSASGGERLLLIGEWNQSNSYKIILNEKIICPEKINQHVLEAVLPGFENLTNSNLKSLIYVYEGQLLFCEPIPFEIKPSIFQKYTDQLNINYKLQLFLLERVVTLIKCYKCNLNNDIQHSNESSFEYRIISLIDYLVNHLKEPYSSSKDSSTTQFVLNNEHEGKNIVNLCIELKYTKLFEKLKQLKSIFGLEKNTNLDLLKNELSLFTFDHHGTNAMMLICQRGIELFDVLSWLEEDLAGQDKYKSISSWIFSILKCKEEANKNNHKKLETQLSVLIDKAQNKMNLLNDESSSFDLRFIDNLDELTSFLNDNEESKTASDYQCLFPSIELLTNPTNHLALNNENILEIKMLSNPETSSVFPIAVNSANNQPVSNDIETIDYQEKKIKTLADNIIAAMPHRIKIHKSFNFDSAENNCDFSIQSLDRNPMSLDENFIDDTGSSFSSTHSSVSFSSPQTFYHSNNFIDIQNKETSPDLNETSNSSFRIDSPPSTAEFCQYFHATSTPRCSIESGFAQLTLTDEEQRELYEAALIIQNAYRKYLKKKKVSNQSTMQSTPVSSSNSYFNFDDTLSEKNSSTFETDSCSNSINNLMFNSVNAPDNQTMLHADYDTDSTYGSININLFNHEQINNDQKQFEAACIIQKYYRRYKQYENVQKYNDAASKIQKKYRAYKSLSLSNAYHQTPSKIITNNFHHNSFDQMIDGSKKLEKMSDQYLYSNQKLIARKLVNIRPNSRFSPSSMCNSNSIRNFLDDAAHFHQHHNHVQTSKVDSTQTQSNVNQLINSGIDSIEFLNKR